MSPLELWAGAECTINRVGDRWRDQAALTGFRHRLDDLDRLATLGARRVRLPVLWEHLDPAGTGELDFAWPDQALARLRELGVEAIAGLLHHGSGPPHTHLLDKRFPELFAAYARRVAQRYPEQRSWTPINEPLTTARFSCLYGVWYPHAQDDCSFVRALLHQVRATVLAMRAIREINPAAELVQTDDLGHTRCTPGLAAQAAFDNERRWLAFDLLCGRVDEAHPMWDWLCGCGVESELRQLLDEPCPPQIIGINAYVTSERFLDERLELHPPHLHGGNGREAYVDIETVRVHGELIDGFAGRLREAHARYGLPLAITEVHLGCTREEQMRWLHQAWLAAAKAREEGVAVRAVTAWAAFGAVDWSSLLTREAGHYEPGLWDARSEPPRLTALGRLAAALAEADPARTGDFHPVLASPGWWQRGLRLSVAPHGEITALPARGAPLLILGTGAMARAFARLCHLRGLPYEMLAQGEGELADAIQRHAAWAVIDTAADERRRLLPGDRRAARMLVVCSGAIEADRDALVVRTSAPFGPWDRDDFVARGLALLRQGREWPAADDEIVAPTYLPDLVQACLDLLVDGETGTWHLTHGEPSTWAALAMRAAEHAGLDASLVRALAAGRLGQPARRAAPAAASGRGSGLLPSLDDALARYQRDHEPVPGPIPALRAAADPPPLPPALLSPSPPPLLMERSGRPQAP
jgi:dTDP-4-dehydrorhamnose reductase